MSINELVDNQYITKIAGNKKQGQKDFYKFNPIKCEEIEKFGLSYFAVLGVIKENITPEDFKVYCYLRYRLHRGLNLIQEEIANELGISQQSISKHIKSLIDEKYLELKCVSYDVSKFGLNVYKINH
jgi:predicted transcriptional regulator